MKNTHNPNRPRSSKNPKGKRNNPPINWPDYNKGRKSEGKYYIKWMAKVANKIREIMDMPQGKHDLRISTILVSIVKSEKKISYGEPVKHFDKHPGDLEGCDLLWPYDKSLYQLRLSQIKTDILQQIITWMAGDEAVCGTKIVDFCGFGISRHKGWYNAKYGNLRVQDFAKLHAIHTPHGKISAAMVTHSDDSILMEWIDHTSWQDICRDGYPWRSQRLAAPEKDDAERFWQSAICNWLP